MSQKEFATFASGCFWGPDQLFRKHFGGKGLISIATGYTNGSTANPNYKQVCSGTTGHAEAVRIEFDPSKVSYEELVEFHFRTHDATQLNHQGPDKGTQYRSGIYYHSDEQKAIAEKVRDRVQEQHYKGQKIVTEIEPAGEWTNAEDYHQDYLNQNENGYHCPTHFLRW